MNTNLLLENISLFSYIPNGIEYLRKLIYQLATTGALSEQNSKEKPFGFKVANSGSEIPDNWIWCELQEIAIFGGRGSIKPDLIPTDSWLLDLEDIEKVSSKLLVRTLAGNRKTTSNKSIFNKGDVLYGKLRPYLDKVLVADLSGYCTTEIIPIQPHHGIDPRWLRICLKRPGFIAKVTELSYGTKMPRLGTEDAKKSLHPVPPLQEQERIINRVDQLMELCDQLEIMSKHAQKLSTAARNSAVAAISTAETPEETQKAWERIEGNWEFLTGNSDSVESIRFLVHDLATRGVFSDEEIFEVVELKDIAQINYGYTESAKRTEVGPKFLRITDIQVGKVDWETVPYCPISSADEEKYLLKDGDLVFARTGATTGKSFLLHNPPRSVCASYLIRVRPDAKKVLPEYLYLYFQSGQYWVDVKSGMSGTAQGGFNSSKLGALKIRIPDLKTQVEIVKKTNELLQVCGSLEKCLLKQQILAEKFARSVVSESA
jgi:type I restriction enzyme, S subunit